eukprot:3683816-Amphidinium_carterae.1
MGLPAEPVEPDAAASAESVPLWAGYQTSLRSPKNRTACGFANRGCAAVGLFLCFLVLSGLQS